MGDIYEQRGYQNTDENESVLTIPEGAMLNFITDRPTKPLYYHLIPNHVTALKEDNIIKGLNSDKPDYIIATDMKYDMYGKSKFCEDYGNKICRFIDENYTEKEQISVSQPTGETFNARIYKKN